MNQLQKLQSACVTTAFNLYRTAFVFFSQELYERCDKLRRSAFKMATEAEDNDTNLGLQICFVFVCVCVCSIFDHVTKDHGESFPGFVSCRLCHFRL